MITNDCQEATELVLNGKLSKHYLRGPAAVTHNISHCPFWQFHNNVKHYYDTASWWIVEVRYFRGLFHKTPCTLRVCVCVCVRQRERENLFLRMIWKIAWDRDECMLADVTPDVRTLFPCWINRNTSSTHRISSSLSPTTCTCCLASSSTRSFSLLFSKSNTCHIHTHTYVVHSVSKSNTCHTRT